MNGFEFIHNVIGSDRGLVFLRQLTGNSSTDNELFYNFRESDLKMLLVDFPSNI